MPRYFFHVIDGHASIDTEGTELAGINDARAQAIETAGEILRDKSSRSWTGTEWTMTVCDAKSKALFSIKFSATDYPE